jgi:hypothetical protein
MFIKKQQQKKNCQTKTRTPKPQPQTHKQTKQMLGRIYGQSSQQQSNDKLQPRIIKGGIYGHISQKII